MITNVGGKGDSVLPGMERFTSGQFADAYRSIGDKSTELVDRCHNVNCTCLRAAENQDWGQILFHTSVVYVQTKLMKILFLS